MKSKENNPTFSSENEFLVQVEAIVDLARRTIAHIESNPPISFQDREDLLQKVSLRCWRWYLRIPRGRGQKAYVTRMVFNALWEMQESGRPYVVVVLPVDVDIKDVLPTGRMTLVPASKVEGLKPDERAYRGRVRGMRASGLWSDARVLRLIVHFEGFTRLAREDSETGEDECDPMDNIAFVEPFRDVEARLDREYIVNRFATENPLGSASFISRHCNGNPWKKVADDSGYCERACQVALKKLQAQVRRDFGEFLG